jgi:hypothetical protein
MRSETESEKKNGSERSEKTPFLIPHDFNNKK